MLRDSLRFPFRSPGRGPFPPTLLAFSHRLDRVYCIGGLLQWRRNPWIHLTAVSAIVASGRPPPMLSEVPVDQRRVQPGSLWDTEKGLVNGYVCLQ